MLVWASEAPIVEACLTSNRLTGACADLTGHPVRQLLKSGVPVCLATDNTLVFGTTLSAEFALGLRLGLVVPDDLRRMMLSAASHSFAEVAKKHELAREIEAAYLPETLKQLTRLAE